MTQTINSNNPKPSLPGNWDAFEHDLLLLKNCSEDDLDVTTTDNGKSFQLIQRSFSEKIAEIISSIFDATQRQARLDRLGLYYQKTHTIFEKKAWRFDPKKIAEFYLQGLSKWSTDTFKRSTLPLNIQDILCKDLGDLRRAKERYQRNPHSKELSQDELDKQQMQEAKLKAELAFNLGIKPKKNKGANGSIIFLDIQGKPIGIFKREKAPLSWPKWLRRQVSHRVPSVTIRTQSDLCRHDQAKAEVAASFADRFFSIGLIPLTRTITLNGKTGSFMLWQFNMKEAIDFTFRKTPSPNELYQFQLMVIYDYLLGNLDRHLENWLIGSKTMQKLEWIAMIDNGNAFPEEHPTEKPGDYFGRQKMYKWKEHPWSKYSFDPRIMSKMRALTPQKILQFIQYLSDQLSDQCAPFLSRKGMDSLHLRASVLYEIGHGRKSDCRPVDLGNTFSDEQILSLKKSLKKAAPTTAEMRLKMQQIQLAPLKKQGA